jgi:hypothetical protein
MQHAPAAQPERRRCKPAVITQRRHDAGEPVALMRRARFEQAARPRRAQHIMPTCAPELFALPVDQLRKILRRSRTERHRLRAKILFPLPRQAPHLLEVLGMKIALRLPPRCKPARQIPHRRAFALAQIQPAPRLHIRPSRKCVGRDPSLREHLPDPFTRIRRRDRTIHIAHRRPDRPRAAHATRRSPRASTRPDA